MNAMCTLTLLVIALAPLFCIYAAADDLECFTSEDHCSPEHKIKIPLEIPADCCLGDGYWYVQAGSDDCLQCVVYGFPWHNITVEEGSKLTTTIKVLKGALSSRHILFGVQSVDGTATFNKDYGSITSRQFVNRILEQDVLIDSVAFEGQEWYTLSLNVQQPPVLRSNEFVQDTLHVYITDRTNVSFHLTEEDYVAKEKDGFISISVAKSPVNTELAQPVTLVARAMPLNRAPDGHTLVPGASATISDFNNSVADGFEFEFPTKANTREVELLFPIKDDDINEGVEKFFIVLELSSKEKLKADVITFDRFFALCTILDDDDISISFEERSFTFSEGDGKISLKLLKFPPGRTSEQNFTFDIFADRSSSSLVFGKDVTVPSKSIQTFLSTEQIKTFEFNLLDDIIPEEREILTLRLFHYPGAGYRPVCRNTLDCHYFVTVTIVDNDDIEVGFTNLSIEVGEEIGNVEVCVEVQKPNTSVPLEVYIALTILMNPGSADTEDYIARDPFNFELHNDHRLDCPTVFIIDDNLKEGQENFTMSVLQDTFSSLPITFSSSSVLINIIDDEESVNFWCPLLSPPTNGEVMVSSELYLQADVANYSCHSGFLLNGTAQRTCLLSRDWSGYQPNCERVCEPLSNPANGLVSSTSNFAGDVSTYSCIVGYRIIGPSSRTCQSDGQWSGTEPSCEINCPILSSPSNAHVSVSHNTGVDIAQYYCNIGYFLTGSSQRTCLSNGVWSGNLPSCIPIRVTVGFEMTSQTVNEGDHFATFCIEISTPSSNLLNFWNFTLRVTTSHVTTDDSDFVQYTASNQPSLEPFGYTKSRQCFLLTIVDDTIPELDQRLTLTVSLAPGQAAIASHLMIDPRVTTLNIIDNDMPNCRSLLRLRFPERFRHCLHQCSYSSWSKWSVVPGSIVSLTDPQTCLSKEAENKLRTRTVISGSGCTVTSEMRLFCKPSEVQRIISALNLGSSGFNTLPISTSEDQQPTSGPAGRKRRQTPISGVSYPGPKCPQNNGASFVCGRITESQYEPNQQRCPSGSLTGSSRTEDCIGIHSILFILDTSGSIPPSDFNRMKRAIGSLVPYLCSKIQVAVMTFDTDLKTEFCFNCYENTEGGRRDIIAALNNIAYRGHYTSTGEAARCAFHEFLTPYCGLHPLANCIDVVFITDGGSNGQLDVCREAECLRNHQLYRDFLHVYAIGIGPNVNTAEIDCITGSDSDSIFSLKSFDEFEIRINKTVDELFGSLSYTCAHSSRSKSLGTVPLYP